MYAETRYIRETRARQLTYGDNLTRFTLRNTEDRNRLWRLLRTGDIQDSFYAIAVLYRDGRTDILCWITSFKQIRVEIREYAQRALNLLKEQKKVQGQTPIAEGPYVA